jgi:hypothetical protein
MGVMLPTEFRTGSGLRLVRTTTTLKVAARGVCLLCKLLNYLEELL